MAETGQEFYDVRFSHIVAVVDGYEIKIPFAEESEVKVNIWEDRSDVGRSARDKVMVRLDLSRREILEALREQYPSPPEFDTQSDAEAWLDRYPQKT